MTRDERLEAAIEAKRQELITARTLEKRRDAWYTMKSLIESRSVAWVWHLEREAELMRQWSTDGSIEADSRYPLWLKWTARRLLGWALNIAWAIVKFTYEQ